MLKAAGSLLILLSAAGIAGRIKRELEFHLQMLYELRKMFVQLEQQTKITLLPMEELLKEAGEGGVLAQICTQIAVELQLRTDAAPEHIWRDTFLQRGKELGISNEELRIAAEAGSAFFGKNLEENERKLTLYLEQMDFAIQTARREQKEKQRVYQTVSILGGMMAVILLI